MQSKQTAAIQVDDLPSPPPIVSKLKVGLTQDLQSQLLRYARLKRLKRTVAIRQILETELPRRIARMEARTSSATR